MPTGQILVEHGVDEREVPFVVCHEYLERRLMRDAGLGYDRAHEIASALDDVSGGPNAARPSRDRLKPAPGE